MKPELILVGGGLANCLIALRVLGEDPGFRLLILEREGSLGVDHTWSFHDTDLTVEQRARLETLIVHAWPHHELRFPGRRRVMHGGYNTVTSQRLHEVVAGLLGERAMMGVEVTDVSPDGVQLADGRSIAARTVIDGRGDPRSPHLELGYQKFLGLFVRLGAAHGLDGPILMDATVEQRDGYRFIYTLPITADELLIEDTYYSDDPMLDRQALRDGIHAYAARQGWKISGTLSTESGVLPIVLDGDIDAFWNADSSPVPRSGMRGAFFHPTTGYSLPAAVALADEILAHRHLDGRALHALTRHRSEDMWREGGFYRLLNRMLFRAAEPALRYRVFERFYGLSAGLIERFYAQRLTWTDKVRLLSGRPPVPILSALRCLR